MSLKKKKRHLRQPNSAFLQNSPSNSKNVLGFSESNYKKIEKSKIQGSRPVDTSSVNIEIDCDNSYYTIIGKLLAAPGELKTTDENWKVKEDNIIVNKTEQIGLHVRGEIIDMTSNEITYKISHLKIRKFKSEQYMTTTPLSILAQMEEIDASVKEVTISNESLILICAKRR